MVALCFSFLFIGFHLDPRSIPDPLSPLDLPSLLDPSRLQNLTTAWLSCLSCLEGFSCTFIFECWPRQNSLEHSSPLIPIRTINDFPRIPRSVCSFDLCPASYILIILCLFLLLECTLLKAMEYTFFSILHRTDAL